jgi:competence protein ComEC
MTKYFYLCLISLFFLGGFFFYQSAKFNDGKLHLVVCNVGQGDAIFIRTPNGSDILIDGGPDDSVLNCLSSHMPFWDRTIELLVLSHPHTDHLTGLISVVNRYKVMHYVTENVQNGASSLKRLQAALAVHDLIAKYTFSGERIDLSDKTYLLTVWPTSGWMKSLELQDNNNLQTEGSSLDTNGFCLIQLLVFGNFRALLTGDAGSIVEDKVAAQVGKIDVLKVSHHGSKTGLSSWFLEKTSPKLAIISVGAKNKYGHPAREALDLLKSHNIKTLRTDKDGEVEIVTDGKTINLIN